MPERPDKQWAGSAHHASLLAAGPTVTADRSEVVLTHVETDCAALHRTGGLVEAEMDPAVDASIVDVVGDLS